MAPSDIKTPPYLITMLHPTVKYPCQACKRNVSHCTCICIRGSDNDYRFYCVGCFAKLQQYPKKYHVIQRLDYPVYDRSWSTREELLMFEGIQKHGFGNWKDIAIYMDTDKNAEDLQAHYMEFYLSKNIPEIDQTFREEINGFQPSSPSTSKTCESSNKTVSMNTRSQSEPRLKITKFKLSVSELLGYMPLRQDFQVQYDNDAQLLLANLQFTEDDDIQDRELKHQIIEIYNKRVEQRNKRKKFIKNMSILESDCEQKYKGKEEKQIVSMMKVFSRFQSQSEHFQLIDGLIRERRVRKIINQYQSFRQKGLTTLEQVQSEFEKKRTSKTIQKSSRSLYLSSFYPKRQDSLPFQEYQLSLELKISPSKFLLIKEIVNRELQKSKIIDLNKIINITHISEQSLNQIINYLSQEQEISS